MPLGFHQLTACLVWAKRRAKTQKIEAPRRPILSAGVTGLALFTTPGGALACALPPSIILTLPTGHYIWAAALTVVMTAVFSFWQQAAGAAWIGEERNWQGRLIAETRIRGFAEIGSWLGLIGLIGLSLIGIFGDRDPMQNLMTLVFWVGIWVALPLASMIFGNLWGLITPWRAPVASLRRLIGWQGQIGLSRLGYWPAALGFAAFSWFQMVGLYPDDPAVLGKLALLYWLSIFILAVAEGEDWLERGEFFTVLFTMLSRVAPLWRQQRGERLRWLYGPPGTQVLTLPDLPLSGLIFVTMVLAALSFDGLSETFFWQALIGQNPLEPLGRSAVVVENSLGLFGTWVLTLGLILGALRLGRLEAGRVCLSFLVIAAGYHLAHYLVMLLSAGQYLRAALNDPLHLHWALLGLEDHAVSMGFLADPAVMTLIYATQFAAILLAHLLALVLSLKFARGERGWQDHLPLTLLMVAYTVFGLWLLSTARTG